MLGKQAKPQGWALSITGLQLSDQPLHRADGATQHSHTRAGEQPVLPDFLAQTEIKLRATSTSVAQLSKKCCLEKVFILTFYRFVNLRDPLIGHEVLPFLKSINNRFRWYKISRIFPRCWQCRSRKRCFIFTAMVTLRLSEKQLMSHAKIRNSSFFPDAY